jgi:subtilisin family serine protease
MSSKEVKVVLRNDRAKLSIALLLLLTVCTGAYAYDADSATVYREIVVSLNPGTIILPQGSDSAVLAEDTITSPVLETLLVAYGAEIIALRHPGFDAAETLGISRSGDTIRLSDLRNVFMIRFPTGTDIEQLCADLEENVSEVIYADANGMSQSDYDPNDYYYRENGDPRQWNLKNDNGVGINVQAAWDVTRGSPSTTIAIVDGYGVKLSHEDFDPSRFSGDTTNLGSDHPTHLAGIIAAHADNGIGIAGIDWHAHVLAKSYGGHGPTEESKYREAIAESADIINCSWSYDGQYDDELRNAFRDAYRLGIVSVVSMGNHESEGRCPSAYGAALTDLYPDDSAWSKTGTVIAVGATDSTDRRVTESLGYDWESRTGNFIDVVAPGATSPSTGIWSTTRQSYGYMDGTSMAAPQVAGVAGLLLAANPALTNDDIRWIIRIYTDWLGEMGDPTTDWTPEDGGGRLNAYRAVTHAISPYEVRHLHATGGIQAGEVTDWYEMEFPSDWRTKWEGQTKWMVRRHEYHVAVDKSSFTDVHVWGRNQTKGWSAGERYPSYPNRPPMQFEEGWCNVIDQSISTATLRTYVYDVKRAKSNGDTISDPATDTTWPVQPQHIRFEYTVLGIPEAVGWTPLADIPPGSKNKQVKDGGCLAGIPGTNDEYLYALKGNGTFEFYRYSTVTNNWLARESIPAIGRSQKKKAVKKGAALVLATDSKVYATKGNNTYEFWQYDPAEDSWTQKADVPAGARAVREGGGAVGAVSDGSDCVYLLKGSNTCEFFRYDASANIWETMASPPTGASGRNFKNGSCLAYGGDTIYALKGGTNEFYAYSVRYGNWVSRETIPQVGVSGRKTRAKDGTGLTYLNGKVYALKGNKTNDVFQYDPGLHVWTRATSVPAFGTKGVSSGGALTAAAGRVWALRGNNTRAFYAYVPGEEQEPPAGPSGSPPGANELLVYSGPDCAVPKFSPNGDWVAFSAPSGSSNQVWRAPASGGTATVLTSLAGSITEVAPSPNCALVAFAFVPDGSPFSQVGIVPSDGGQVTVLTSGSLDHEGICWRMDGGSGIFYSCDVAATGCSQLGFVPVSGGSEQILTSTAHGHDCPKSLTPSEAISQGEDQPRIPLARPLTRAVKEV